MFVITQIDYMHFGMKCEDFWSPNSSKWWDTMVTYNIQRVIKKNKLQTNKSVYPISLYLLNAIFLHALLYLWRLLNDCKI